MASNNLVPPALPVMFVMPTHQREDIFRLPITLLGKTAKKWIELRKEHGIGDQDFADLLMHRYESTSHLFVPVPSVSGSSTMYTFNGPIGVDKHPIHGSKLVKKKVKKSQDIIIAPKPLKLKESKKKAEKDEDGSPPKKKKKVVDMVEDLSDSAASVGGFSDGSLSDVGDESDEYKPEEDSHGDESEELAESTEEWDDEDEEIKKKKATLGEGKGYKQYDTREVAKQEGFAPKPLTRPKARLKRMYWSSLTKSYQCKICSFQDSDPRLTCQHLLQQHGEVVTELHDYLLSQAAPDFKPGITLYHVVMAEPSQLIAMAWQGSEHAGEKDGGTVTPGQSKEANKNGANLDISDQSLEDGFGLSQAEAAHSLVNMAETTLVTVAQLEENVIHEPSESPSSVARRQLEMLQMQANEACVSSDVTEIQPTMPQSLSEPQPSLTTLDTRPAPSDSTQAQLELIHTNLEVPIIIPTEADEMKLSENTSEKETLGLEPQLEASATKDDLVLHHSDGMETKPETGARQEDMKVPENEGERKEPEDIKTEEDVGKLPPKEDSAESKTDSGEVESTETKCEASKKQRRRGRPTKTKSVKAKRSRGRPKGSGSKKTKSEDLPPVKEDPFDKNEFLQILMKWVKIMVSCSTCGKSLHNLGIINKKGVKISHVCRTHEGPNDGDLLCDLCGKSFMSARGFKIHWQENHGNMERAVCQFCGKVVKGSYLSQHINRCHTHTTEAYKCAMCGKGFKSKSACDKHEVVHRTEKPFKCPYCQRGFTQQANMKHHMRQHTGEQPYRCETCSKSFTHNVSLKNHLKRQHGVDLWQMGHTGGGRPKKEKPPPVETVENKPFM